MQKVRTEKGITLIALIITIIVMLILVGVTVSVALNGGLFTTAKQATNKTQLELDKEQLLELALGAMDKEGNVSSAEITKSGRFTYADGVYTSVKSGNKFTVSKWGSVAEINETQVYTLSGKYLFKGDYEITFPENVDMSQTISFTVGFGTETKSYNEMSLGFDDYDGIFYLIKYDNELMYHEMAGAWDYAVYDYCKEIDFGSTQQEVSEEFYTWFTANATPVE